MSAGLITDQLDNACTHLHACLLPGGQIATAGIGVPEEVRWQELGSIHQAGVPMSFVRVVIGESTWATLVPTTQLAADQRGVRVTLARQHHSGRQHLCGWSRLC